MEALSSSAATLAIISARFRAQWRLIVILSTVSFLLGCAEANSLATHGHLCGPATHDRLIWLMHSTFLLTALGIIAAFCNHNVAAISELEFLEQSAPLYGRQLARARALVPCIIVCCDTLTYLAATTKGVVPPAYFGALVGSTAVCTVLIALSASLRTGWPRILYVALALCSAFIAAELAGNFPCFSPIAITCEIAFCSLVGFVALRAYGEALARYDPVSAPTR